MAYSFITCELNKDCVFGWKYEEKLINLPAIFLIACFNWSYGLNCDIYWMVNFLGYQQLVQRYLYLSIELPKT